jgi:chalcone isomerase-like protein
MVMLIPMLFAGAALAGTPAPRLGVISQDSIQTTSVAGVALPRRIRVENQWLLLNGMALRKKAIFKVYVAGLYLPSPERSADRILANDAPRHLVMQFVRDVKANQMCDAWKEGLADNTRNPSPALKEQFNTLCRLMEKVRDGDQLAFTYLPGIGTNIYVKGQSKGIIPGKEFADALFKSWIGPRPGPGEDFKRRLLGA